NGFPVLFSPVTLRSYRSDCGNRTPAWVRDDKSDDPLSRIHQQANAARTYLDGDHTRYVHLMDGGISDNLAMRGMINAIVILTSGIDVERYLDLKKVRRIVLISADGQAANNGATAQQESLTSLTQIFNAASGTQIDNYNFETLLLAKTTIDEVRDV